MTSLGPILRRRGVNEWVFSLRFDREMVQKSRIWVCWRTVYGYTSFSQQIKEIEKSVSDSSLFYA